MGIDAHLEVVSNGEASGRLLAVQIKSGNSQFAESAPGGWWFRCDADHVEYWQGHSLPVVVALYRPGTQAVYWQHVNDETLVGTGKNWKVFVPSSQQLDEDCAQALSAPARRQPDQGRFHDALDRLPSDPRDTLMRDHAAGAAYAVHLAPLLADAADPAVVVKDMLASPPQWICDQDEAHQAGAWRAVAGYAAAHELGLVAVDALERAADTDDDTASASRLRALAAILAVAPDPERARALIAASTAEAPVLASVAQAQLSGLGYRSRSELPEVVERALDAGDLAATGESTVLLFVAHTRFAADRYDDGMAALEKAVQLAPSTPALLVALAEALMWHTTTGAPTFSYLDTRRALRLAGAARAECRRWRGPSGAAALALLRIRLITDNVALALDTALAAPQGEAQGVEVDYQPLLLDSARAAYEAGLPATARQFADRLEDAGARAQMAAVAVDTDLASDANVRISAWQQALDLAGNDEQRSLAAVALTGLGVWPVPAWELLHDQGIVSDALYNVRWACAEEAAGDRPAAIRRLRQWETESVMAAMALVEFRSDDLAVAADIAERAGSRFGDLPLRVHAVQLWEKAEQHELARLRALTLLSRPHLPAGMRRDLRGRAVQWAYDRQDWIDMEDHAMAGLVEELGEQEPITVASRRTTSGIAALFAWAAVRAQFNSRRLGAAWRTVTHFDPAISSAGEANIWLTLVDWAGWSVPHVEHALDLADRYPALGYDIGTAILRATGGAAPSDTEGRDRSAGHPPLDLPAPLGTRLAALLDGFPADTPALMPMSASEITRFVVDTLGPRQAVFEAVADAVRIGIAPLSLLAQAASRPHGLAFAQRAAGHIPAATSDRGQCAAEARAALAALDGAVTLDLSAIAVATLIPGRFEELRATFSATTTATTVHDDLVNTRYALESLQRASGQLGVHAGAATFTTLSQQDKEHLAERATAFNRVIPTLGTRTITDVGPLHTRLRLAVSPDAADVPWLHAAELALDTDTPLWCDDAALRQILQRSGIPTFGTLALLQVLTRHNDYPQFTPQRLQDDTRTLMRAYVVDLPLDPTDLTDAAKAESWHPGYAAAPLERPSFWATDHSEDTWSAMVASMWETEPAQLAPWYAIAARGCSALTAPQNVPVLLASLTALTLLAVGLGPEPVEALWPTALRTLETCLRASHRRWSVVTNVEPVAVPSTEAFTDLTRQQLLGRLTNQLGFSETMAHSMVDAALI